MNRIVFAVLLAVTSIPALAAKPDKTLVCHVGNQLGSNGESYQDNSECDILPPYDGDPADYICPDAGKVDLILVSEKAAEKHIAAEGEEPIHYFDDGSIAWEDYSPGEGVGDNPADFEEGDIPGIDKGCELEQELLTCPCWAGETVESILAEMNIWAATAQSTTNCYVSEFEGGYYDRSFLIAVTGSGALGRLEAYASIGKYSGRCRYLSGTSFDTQEAGDTEVESLWGLECVAEWDEIMGATSFCDN